MNNQFEKNFALAKRHENQLIACLEDYFGSSFSPAELGEDKYRKIDFFSNCRQKIPVGARVCRHTAWEYRSQVTISDNKSIHKSEHDEWMVAGKGPDYFIYGHIAPDGEDLQMVVLVSLAMLRTKKGKRINSYNFFAYPITDPGVVLCCWYSPAVRDDPIINILSGPKKPFQPLTPLRPNREPTYSTSEKHRISPPIPSQILEESPPISYARYRRRSRRYQWHIAIVTVLLLSGVVFGIYSNRGMAQIEIEAKKRTNSHQPNLIVPVDAMAQSKPEQKQIEIETRKQTESSEPNLIAPEDAMTYLDQTGTVCGEVASSKYAVQSKGRPTYLNIGKPYPNHIFTAVIWDTHRAQFGAPEQRYKGKWVCVTGRITVYQGAAQIEVQEREYLSEVDGPTFKYLNSLGPNLIAPEDAMAYLDQTGTVCGEVASSKYAVQSNGRPTFLNIGKPYPNHLFTVVIPDEYRAQFGAPEQRYKGKWICMTGKITAYQGVPQIEVKEIEYLSEVDEPTFKYVKKFLSGPGVRQE